MLWNAVAKASNDSNDKVMTRFPLCILKIEREPIAYFLWCLQRSPSQVYTCMHLFISELEKGIQLPIDPEVKMD